MVGADARIRRRVPARDDRAADPAAGLPEAAPADLGRLPVVARELRMDGEGGPQPALRRLSRRPRDRGRAHRLVPGRAAEEAGRKVEDHEICCVYHAYFLAEGDDSRLEATVHGPMSEYAAAGLEATRNPADPVAYKGYEQRDAGQRRFTFESYFPGRVLMGGPDQAIERIRVLADIGITQIGMLVDFGSLAPGGDHALAGDLREGSPAACEGLCRRGFARLRRLNQPLLRQLLPGGGESSRARPAPCRAGSGSALVNWMSS